MISHPQWTHLKEHAGHRLQGANAFIIECPTCGYEPDEQVVIQPVRCPKCHCYTWHRIPRPGMLADHVIGRPVLHHDHRQAAYAS